MQDASQQQTLPSPEELARALSLRLLDPGMTDAALLEGCRRAVEAGLGAVTVFPSDAERALRVLEGASTSVAAMAGFPYGATTTAAKLYEARDLLRRGVRDLGFVLNAAQLLSREFQQVETELMQIGRSCAEAGARLHAVVESALLAEDLCVIVTKICKRCDVSVLCISTGMHEALPGGAALDLFRRIARGELALGLMAQELELDPALEAWRRGASWISCGNAVRLAAEWKARIEAQMESGQAG
jgi:deoxyribose-phosphate aldolase